MRLKADTLSGTPLRDTSGHFLPPLGGSVRCPGKTGIPLDNELPKGLIEIQEVLRYLETDRYISKAEASHYLGLSVRTLEARKDVPRYQLERGGKVLFRKSELDRWMSRHRVCVEDSHADLSRLVDDVVNHVLRAE